LWVIEHITGDRENREECEPEGDERKEPYFWLGYDLRWFQVFFNPFPHTLFLFLTSLSKGDSEERDKYAN
jgi:hypothetical protein